MARSILRRAHRRRRRSGRRRVHLRRDGSHQPRSAGADRALRACGAEAGLRGQRHRQSLRVRLAPPLVEALRSMAAQGRMVCVDARYGLAKYRGVTVAKPNEVELEAAVGRPLGDDTATLEEAGRELLKTLRSESLLVTRGRNG